ncbi:MAG: general secretion pathway protein GspB [Rhodoferax sp.]|jgi:general secretion pathway protein B|nr:general secretion pathway protein GspB [Rhodoferax sp.]MCL4739404.1 general secretion pathway protein GspB [Burkholderiaceae bacterium]
MSYVLDALRRAESERARGELPGLHAQPLPAAAPAAGAPAAPRRVGAIVALGVALLLALAAAAWWTWAEAPSRQAGADAGSLSSMPPRAATRETRAASPPMPAAAEVEQPAAADRHVGPVPVPPRPVVREPAPVQSAAASPASADEATATAGDEPIPRLADLPPALRAQLPPLAFGGATDSPQASARMLIVNGRVAREGDEIAPGVVLERIRLRSAQMRLQGRRFVVDY